MKIAVYGSLRPPEYNFQMMVDGVIDDYGVRVVDGYSLFDFGCYPIVVENVSTADNLNLLTVHLFDVGKVTFDELSYMELSAGYHASEVTVDKEQYVIWLQNPEDVQGLHKVPSGDWVEYRKGLKENELLT